MIKLGLLDIYGQVAPRSHQLLQVMLQKYPGELIDYFVSECAWTRATCLTMLKAYDNVEHDPELKKLNFEKARADANAAMTATDSYFLQVANFLIPRIPKDNWAIILTQITKEPYYAYSAFGHYRQKLGAALKSLTL